MRLTGIMAFLCSLSLGLSLGLVDYLHVNEKKFALQMWVFDLFANEWSCAFWVYIYFFFLFLFYLSSISSSLRYIDQPFSFSFSKVLFFFSSWTGTAHPSSSSPSLSIFPPLLHLTSPSLPGTPTRPTRGAPNRQRVYWCELCSSPKHPSRALLPIFLVLTIGTSFNNPPKQPDPNA